MRIIDRIEYESKAKPLTFTADTTVDKAVAVMSERNYGSVVIVDGDKIAGMVTERDIMKRLVNEGRDAKKTTLGDIMTKDVRVAKETDDVRDWMRIMSNERFRRLPVVDTQGKLVSIMTQGDFVSYTWPELLDQVKDKTLSTVSNNSQLFLIAGGVLLYSIVLVFLLAG